MTTPKEKVIEEFREQFPVKEINHHHYVRVRNLEAFIEKAYDLGYQEGYEKGMIDEAQDITNVLTNSHPTQESGDSAK